jgi:4-amino-4-deoxy-L-arabinose transferase-like glycosyltransferase
MAFVSARFQSLQHALPWLRPCLPDQFLRGIDYVSQVAASGTTTTYLFGRTYPHPIWFYYPVALLAKWPIGFLLSLAVGGGVALSLRRTRKQEWGDDVVVIAIVALLVAAVAGTSLNVGIRYLYPILPLLCVALGRTLVRRPGAKAPAWLTRAAVACALIQAIEMVAVAPWYLSFFNQAVGGSERGQFIVNDSNVDWGQGLLALKDEMARRGIRHISLIYHGTADPAVYGIDYETYLGAGAPTGSDWLAVSSYFFVGQSQRMMTREGPTEFRAFDFRPLAALPPTARPAGCMMLFRVPRARQPGPP